MAMTKKKMHIVIFPWLAFGHLLPCLKLAEWVASRGHRVSFVSTPRNISRLRPVPPSLAPLISFVALPLPRVDGLPDGAEATSDIPPGKDELHLKALDGLAEPFSAFLDDAGNKIDWLIVDSFQYWAATAAHSRKIPCVLNLVFSAETLAQYGVPTATAAMPPPVDAFLGGDGGPSSPPSIAQRFVLTFEACKLVSYRSCYELEPESTDLLPGIFGKPVIPVGLLPPTSSAAAAAGGEENDNAACLAWLDKQPPRSVVYAAFGSEAPLTVEQLHEIAHGLELAATAFLWALRKPPPPITVTSDDHHQQQHVLLLPPGFEERTRGRGLVATSWVPQLSILAHAAVGAFFTHCGWSSTIEGLVFGHPLIMLPFLGEQGINAQLVERKQAGVQVPRHGDDRSFHRQGVAASIRAVMSTVSSPADQGQEGVFAANAKKLQEMLAHKNCQEEHIDEFLGVLTSYKDDDKAE